MKNLQHFLVAGCLFLLGTALCIPAFAQTSISSFQNLYDALSGSETTFTAGSITGTLQDENGDPTGFELSSPLDRNITINGNTTLNYTQAGAADEDYLNFSIDTAASLTFNNSLTVSGGYSSGYGTIYVEDGTLTNKGAVRFQKNYTSGVFLLGTTRQAQWTADGKVSFLDNKSYGDGAGLFSDNGTATLAEIEATGNAVSGYGGAVYLTNASALTVNGTAVFGGTTAARGNSSESGGGALAIISGSTGTFNGAATFQNNKATAGNGGAIHLDSSSLRFNDTVTISNNSAAGEGGAVYVSMGTLHIEKAVTVSNNQNSDGYYGGAFHLYDATTTLNDTAAFSDNTSASDGGAVYVNAGTFSIGKDATFTGNKTTSGSGGAIYITGAATNFNADITFEKNTANIGNGGAVYATGESPFLIAGHSVFTENAAVYDAATLTGGDGGAIYAETLGSTGVSTSGGQFGWSATGTTTFSKNTARRGSALYALSSALKFGETTLSENAATFADSEGDYGGGAVYLDSSELEFTGNVTASKNTAASGSGGAFFVTGSGTPDRTAPEYFVRFGKDAAFTENSAKQGGAFSIQSSALSFGGTTTFTGNKAAGDGGALYVGGETLLNFAADTQSKFSNNTAARGGALFAEANSSVTLQLGSNATLDIAQGTTSAAGQNDVFLDSGSTLTLDTAAGAVVSVDSALRSNATDSSAVSLVKDGAGTVQIFGDTSQYTGSVTINQGDVKLDKNGTLGSTASTVLNIANGGRLIVTLKDDASGEADVARLNLNDLVLDTAAEDALVLVRSMDEGEKYALFAMDDSDGSKDKDWWLAALQLDGSGTGLVSADDYILSYDQQASSDGKSIFYVQATFDIDNPNVLWTFTLDQGETQTITSVFDNSKETNKDKILTVNGQGTLTLNPSTENKVGALQGDGNLVLSKNLTVNAAKENPNLTDRTDLEDGVAEFTGNLSGAGSFIKEGDFTQRLTGTAEGFTGAIQVNAGTLIGNTNTLKNEITVSEDTTLVFDQTTIADLDATPSRIFDGTLTGAGTVQIKGSNDVPVSGLSESTQSSAVVFNRNSNDFTGTLDVQTGWLTLDDKAELKQAAFSIGANGGIGGNGAIGGVTIAAGGAIQAYKGNLSVNGDLRFQTGAETGKMYVSIGGTDSGMIDVTGTAFVSGAEVQIVGVGSDYKENTEVQFITGTIDGVFINDLSKEGKIEFVDESSDKTWTFTIWKDAEGKGYWAKGTSTPGPEPPEPDPVATGISANRLQVVKTLGVIEADANTSEEMKAFITALNAEKVVTEDDVITGNEAFLAATQQLAGSVRANGLQLGLYSPYRTVFNRLSLGSEMYGGQPIYNNGYGPISGMQYPGAGSGEVFLGQQPEMMNPYADCAVPTCGPFYCGENRFWADVTHIQTQTSGDGNSDGYGISRTGLLLGMDFQRSDTFRIGGLFGYFAPYLWQNADRVEADDYHGGLYFQKNHFGTEVLGYIGYAHQSYDSRRLVDMTLSDQAYRGLYSGNTSGDSLSFSFEMSRPRYYGNNIIVRPLIGLDYYYTQQDGFSERTSDGSSLFALRYNEAEYDQWFVRVGLNMKREAARSAMNFRIQYINQFGSDPSVISNAYFASNGNSMMNVRGVNLGRDYLNLGGGINVFMNSAQSRMVSFDYDVNMSRRTTEHGVSLILIERF